MDLIVTLQMWTCDCQVTCRWNMTHTCMYPVSANLIFSYTKVNIDIFFISNLNKYILFLTVLFVIIPKHSKNKIQFKVCCWQLLLCIATISQLWLPSPPNNANFFVIITVATISPESDPVTQSMSAVIFMDSMLLPLFNFISTFSELYSRTHKCTLYLNCVKILQNSYKQHF